MPSSDLERLDQLADQLLAATDVLLEQLVAFRKMRGLTQREVADRMGVSQPTVAAFERYDANPRLSSIARYAMAVEALLNLEVTDSYSQSARNEQDANTNAFTIRTAQRQATKVQVKFSGMELCHD